MNRKDKQLEQIVEEIEKKIQTGDTDSLPEIPSAWDAYNLKVMMENTKEWLKGEGKNILLGEAAPVTSATHLSSLEKVFMPMVRRVVPQMIAPRIVGTQALKQPTGVAFFLRARYGNSTGPEAFVNEPNTTFTGKGSDGTIGSGPATDTESDPFAEATAGAGRRTGYTTGIGLSLTEAENDIASTMTVTIEKVSVEAEERQVRALVSIEAQQDAKAYHGINMIKEIENVLTTETALETDRQIIRSMKIVAKDGAQSTNTPGIFDLNVDSDGRWRMERAKALMEQIMNEGFQIFRDTRMGAGNFVMVTSKVASLFAAAGILDYASPLNGKTNKAPVEGAVHLGKLMGMYDVYLDPWPTPKEHVVVGYYGGPLRSGLIYAPYVPIQLVRARDPISFAESIGCKTRYGLTQNPIVRQPNADAPAGQTLYPNNNPFYRIFEVANI